MLVEKIGDQGTTTTRRKFWDLCAKAIEASRKKEGRNVSVNEYSGKGSVISVDRKQPQGCCNRDVDEISAFCIDGLYQCGASSCGNFCFGVWERIDHTEEFTDPKQFKLWIDADCVIHYETNSDVEGGCSSGIITGNGTFTLSFSGLTASIHVTAHAEGSCETCDAEADFSVDVTLCDFSALLGTYSASNEDCVNEFIDAFIFIT